MRPAGEAGGRNASRLLASVPWVVVLLGVGLLTTLLLVALLSFRGSERPAVPPAPAPPMLLPTLSPAAPASAGPTGTPSPTVTPTASPPTPSDRPTARTTASSSPRPLVASSADGALTARYQVTDSDRDSFEAELLVRNGTDLQQDWEVELLFTGNVKSIRVSGGSRVSVRTNGSGWYVLRSGLGAGESELVSLRFTRNGTGDVPGRCTVNGRDCVIG